MIGRGGAYGRYYGDGTEINLPPSMQIIEQVREAGGNDLQFATAAGMKPVDQTTLPGWDDLDRRKQKKVLRKLRVVR